MPAEDTESLFLQVLFRRWHEYFMLPEVIQKKRAYYGDFV